MDIVLKNIKLVRSSYPEKGEPEALITRIPTKEEESIICEQIDLLFNNLLDAHLDEENRFPIDIDEFEEIITLIRGPGRFTWLEKKGILRGEIEIERITGFGGPNLFGLRHSNGGRERYREENVVYVRAYDFIRLPMRWGIALGNIDWMTI